EVCPEPARLQLAGVRRDDDLIRVVLVDGVLDRRDGVWLAHGSARGDPALVQKVKRPAQTPIRARAPAVRVDDEACPRLVLRRNDRDRDGPFPSSASQSVDERLSSHGFVRDHEDMARLGHQCEATFSPSGTSARSPFRTACRAPRTPYSYGLP